MQGNLLADEVHLKFFKLCNHTLAHNNQNYFSRDLSKLSSIIIHFFTNAKLKCLRLQNNLENNAIKTVLNVISFQLTRPCKGVSKRTVTDPEVYNELEGGVIENRVRGVRDKKNVLRPLNPPLERSNQRRNPPTRTRQPCLACLHRTRYRCRLTRDWFLILEDQRGFLLLPLSAFAPSTN